MSTKKISSALISVFNKDNLEPLVKRLNDFGVQLYSTGGTQTYIESLGISVQAIENVTDYPSILGGRVKTLHPKVFGGILNRRGHQGDQDQIMEYNIPNIDMVIVDLYPFEETVASGASHQEIIEKIDIGGISLIRAAAKNYNDVFIISSREQYKEAENLLNKNGSTELEDRKRFAATAFDISSHYDTAIFNFLDENESVFKQSMRNKMPLRYGENPHQKGVYYGDFNKSFEQLNGKQVSYNNLVDIEAAVSLISEFKGEIAFVIIKHTNACGAATGGSTVEAYNKALAADPMSAFGGILISNNLVDEGSAVEINKLFFEILIAPSFDHKALGILNNKKNRILLKQKSEIKPGKSYKSLLNGVIVQDSDNITDQIEKFSVATKKSPEGSELKALEFAGKIAKHTKSNTIVIAIEGQLLASGMGQTSRVDALNQAIAKATKFGFNLNGAVMSSDAFFPFPDCVEIAHKAGITAVIQPGGSIKD
jgi:phosphoribosylaminoimidazolecarboxamide formyltransferase/IMP cyclohydrolase